MKKLKGLEMPIKDLDEVTIDQNGRLLTVRLALATALARAQSEDPVAAMQVSHTLLHAKGNTVELEDAEFTALRLAIKGDRLYTNLVKAELTKVLDAADVPLEPPKDGKKGDKKGAASA